MKAMLEWLEQRTGLRTLVRETFYTPIPGGPRWRYVWGSTVLFSLAVQFITGLFLWTSYSPSAQTAWESVHFIQHEMTGGWLLRGLHHFNAQALPLLLVLHLLQVVLDGAYRAPREVNFWCGVILLQLVIGFSITGWLLTWDQKGFWATRVATNIMGIVPVIGGDLQRILIGGGVYGHHTLTRFFALHAGVLPGTTLVVLGLRTWLFCRHGWAAGDRQARATVAYWPDQALRDVVACLAVLAAVLFVILRPGLAGGNGELGAELRAPADPSEPYSAARPEWFFLFLFQFLKYFPAGREIWGAIVIPSVIMGAVFLMPYIARSKAGQRFNVGLLCVLLLGAATLTLLAKREDSGNLHYQLAVKNADRDGARVRVLAESPTGIPEAGAVTLLRQDPYTQGPKLFAKHCATCHRFGGTDGLGGMVKEPQSAADLQGFGSPEWLAGLLNPERISTTNYFGGGKARDGKMAKFVKKDVAKYTPEQKENLKLVIAALSGEAHFKSRAAADFRNVEGLKKGADLLKNEMRCTDCHRFHNKDEDATAPDLTGYASRDCLVRLLQNPAHPDFYGEHNDRMPAFGDKGILTPAEIGLLADWLRGEWYEPSTVAKGN